MAAKEPASLPQSGQAEGGRYTGLVMRSPSAKAGFLFYLEFDDGVGLDFYQDFGGYKFADFNHGGGGTNVLEEFAVGPADFFPVGDVGDEHTSAYDVFQAGTGAGESGFEVADDLGGLRVGIADADDFAVRASGGGTGDADEVADADGAGVAHNGFPGSAGGEVLAWHIGSFNARVYCVFSAHAKLELSMP